MLCTVYVKLYNIRKLKRTKKARTSYCYSIKTKKAVLLKIRSEMFSL